jgi:hypothetical protein
LLPAQTAELAEAEGAEGAGEDSATYRDWHAGLTEVERRVEQVITMMLAGRWQAGVSDRTLAKRWNVHPSRARQISAEASRQLRKMVRDDPDYLAERKAQLITLFSVITQRALAMANPAGLRCALEAAKATGLYLGIEPARGVALMHSTDPFAEMTDEELEAYASGSRRPVDATEH